MHFFFFFGGGGGGGWCGKDMNTRAAIFLSSPLAGKRDIVVIICVRCMCGGGRVVRWCWVNFQCRGVLQF